MATAGDAPSRQPSGQSHSIPPQPWGDRQLEIVLGNLLRAGVLLSAAIVLAGACVYLSRHAHEHANYRVFINGRGRGLIQLGLLFLIATPIARVAFSIVGFAMERDRMYVVFTVIVLAILLYSLLGSGLTL
jgi:uncharacterized membrane protein